MRKLGRKLSNKRQYTTSRGVVSGTASLLPITADIPRQTFMDRLSKAAVALVVLVAASGLLLPAAAFAQGKFRSESHSPLDPFFRAHVHAFLERTYRGSWGWVPPTVWALLMRLLSSNQGTELRF